MKPLTGFIGPSGEAQASIVDTERTINWYFETRDKGTPKAQSWLYATPGESAWQTIGTGPHRGSFTQDNRAWVVSGLGFYEVFADGSSVLRGAVAPGTDQATIVSNGTAGSQLLVTVGYIGYVYSLTANTLTQIADADFPQGKASMCAFLDGYGIVLVKDSAQFQISALEDFTSWDALDIAQVSQTSDNLLNVTVDLDHKVIWLFGTQAIEIWWDSGAAAFPFEPVPNSLIGIGLGPAVGVLPTSKGMVWIAENSDGGRMLYAGIGSATKRVSSHAVETSWASYATVSDMIAFSYYWRGHEFCVFTCVGGTWVYDTLEDAWTEWLEWDQTAGAFVPVFARSHMYVFDKHLVGSRLDGTLFELRVDVFTDNSQAIRRLRRAPHVAGDGSWLTCDRLRFDFEMGVGLSSGQGSNPQVMLRISRDGGQTFGVERWTSLGAQGVRTARVEYRRNGRWRDGVVQVTVTDPVVVALTGAWADITIEDEVAA